eukprot:9200238-Pyramimonas_sp.AAC.1
MRLPAFPRCSPASNGARLLVLGCHLLALSSAPCAAALPGLLRRHPRRHPGPGNAARAGAGRREGERQCTT